MIVFVSSATEKSKPESTPRRFCRKNHNRQKRNIWRWLRFDILECGICKLFKKHNYEKYSSILCEVDEITSRLAGLKLIRTGTIALGAKKCDFRFKKEITN